VAQLIDSTSGPRSPWFAQMRRQTLPPQALLLRRMEGLVLSALGELRGCADWHAIAAGVNPDGDVDLADSALARVLFGISPGDLPSTALAAGLLLTASVLACLPPAIRAMRVDPVEGLRTE